MKTIDDEARAAVSRIGWGLLARGVLSVLVGVLLLARPGVSLGVLVLILGGYAVADGVIALGTAMTATGRDQRWWLVLHGLAGIAVGLLVLFWPGLSALALLYLIGTWAVVLGAVAIGAALAGPRLAGDRLVLGLHGVLGVLLGVVLWWRPDVGALAVAALLATFALVIGVTQIAMALQLRGFVRAADAAASRTARTRGMT
jgi:uncharacterized membrane protein HdeD (DUF308 family)